jgi:hypothetical protein
VDPKKRYTVEQALKHPFVTKYLPSPPIAQARKQIPPTTEYISSGVFRVPPSPSPKTHAESYVYPEIVAPANIAARVSSNLRMRGMSVSRRKSTEKSSRRQTLREPHPLPPVPTPKPIMSKTIEEDIADTIHSSLDSGIEKSRDSVAIKKEASLMQKLAQLNQLIENSHWKDAARFLQEIDCPTQLHKLYDSIITKGIQLELKAKASGNNSHSSSGKSSVVTEILKELQSGGDSKLKSDIEKYSSYLDNISSTNSQKSQKSDAASFLSNLLEKATNFSSSKKKPEVFPEKAIVMPKEVKILSFNLFMQPPGIKTSSSNHKNSRMEYFMQNVLPNYDIICLQELYAFGNKRKDILLQKASELGLKYSISSPSRGFFEGEKLFEPSAILPSIDGGLLILSRFPIVKNAKLTFEKATGTDRYKIILISDFVQRAFYMLKLQFRRFLGKNSFMFSTPIFSLLLNSHDTNITIFRILWHFPGNVN